MNTLIKKYGSLDEVAKALGIKRRHAQNVLNGVNVGESLRKLILIKIKLIEAEEV